ncbi:MAG: glycosyltransferase family 4 protein, partial [Gammaproteobacteria bacterium]
MRIGIVASDIYPSRGGLELHAYNLASGLTEAGHDVIAYVRMGDASREHNGRFWVVRGVSPFNIGGLLRQDHVEALHGQGARSVLVAVALIVAHRRGLRTLFTPHCFYPPHDLAGRLKRIAFDNTLGRGAFAASDVLICATQNDLKDSLQLGARLETAIMIPNSIRMPIPLSAADAMNWANRNGLGRFLLSVGRLDRVKRGDFLIRALPYLDSDVVLVFVGPDAGRRQQWEQLARELNLGERVRFLGELPDDQVRAAYQSSSLFVMASRYEGLPTVILEAMAFGVPVVAARTGGIGYLLEHAKTGFLFEYDDLRAYCQLVNECLRGDLSSVVRSAQEVVRREYSWESNLQRIIGLYEKDGVEH